MPDPVKDPEDKIVIDLKNPEVKALVDEAVAAAITGLTSNRDTILGEKKILQEKITAQEKLWEGLDPEVVKNLVSRMNNDEETKLIAEGKIDEVIERRTTALKTDLETKLTAALEKITELEGVGKASTGKVKTLVMQGSIRQAGGELGLLPTAYDDAIARANGIFSLDDKDVAVARDASGALQIGKDGKTPLSPHEWLDGMKEHAPHWFPTQKGAGAGGGPGGGEGGNFTMSREQARDPQQYRAMKEQAAKVGQSVQITDDGQASA